MRWSHLAADRQPQPLPLALPAAVARTFDTPGFAGMTFYEVQSRSIINRVPAAARVPFQWTINPYRGCSHACVYCMAGDTQILMADGQTRSLSDLRVGDAIYGTERVGSHRRFSITPVLAHWRTVKPAYRIRLADGTELIASGDHRFLTDRGWKYVTGRESGAERRPHLTRANKLMGIRTSTRRGVAAVHDVIRWPDMPGKDWCAGFLAGIFDAEGSHSRHIFRISNTDPEIIERTRSYLAALGFDVTVDVGEARAATVRIRGGMPEHQRFFHLVDPAITRKRSLVGTAVKTTCALGVEAVEDLGLEIPMFDITTGTGDFLANGVISHNCFARNTHTYLDLDAGRDFDTRVIVKVNAGRLVRRELAAPRWTGEHIAMGTNVDCYQRAEGRYQLMREILAALRDFANPFSILTKGTLILRDLDLLRQAAEVTQVGLSTSIGFVDERLWRAVEPGTPSPRRRLDVVRRLADAGFGVSVLVAPLLPGLSDDEESIDATVAALARAGARSATPIVLHLRPGAREWYLDWLGRTRPDLLPRYRELYRGGSYASKAYQQEVTDRVRAAARRHRLGALAPGEARRVPAKPRANPPEAIQLTLL